MNFIIGLLIGLGVGIFHKPLWNILNTKVIPKIKQWINKLKKKDS